MSNTDIPETEIEIEIDIDIDIPFHTVKHQMRAACKIWAAFIIIHHGSHPASSMQPTAGRN